MDRFRQLRVFVAVAETEGFAAAARRLRSSPPAVTRAVAALEADLGVRLLDRTTRFVRLTEAGAAYLEDARRILDELAAADDALTGRSAEPRGAIAVTAPVLFGRLYVMPVVVEYLQRYSATEVSALFVDRVVNLIEEGLDVGVRIGELPDSRLRGRRVGSVRHLLCAAPGYLALAGRPAGLDELERHTLIASAAGSGRPGWRFRDGSRERSLRVRPRLTTATNDAAVAAAAAGLGIARLLSYQVADEIATGRLVPVLEPFEPPPLPVHVVHREGRYSTPKLRLFIDLLTERLRSGESLGADPAND